MDIIDLEQQPDVVRKILLINTIYFDDPYLMKSIINYYKSGKDLPSKPEIIDLMIKDKQITNDEADRRYTDFINKYYKGVSNDG